MRRLCLFLCALLPMGAESPQLQLHLVEHALHHGGFSAVPIPVVELRMRTRGWGEGHFNVAWNFGHLTALSNRKERLSEPGGMGGTRIVQGHYTFKHQPISTIGLQLTWGRDWQVALLPEVRLALTSAEGGGDRWKVVPPFDQDVQLPPKVHSESSILQPAWSLMVLSPAKDRLRAGLRLGVVQAHDSGASSSPGPERLRFKSSTEVGIFVTCRLWQ